MLKNIFIKLVSFYLINININSKVRDFLMWPIASRIIGLKYDKIITLKNGILMKTDMKDILGRFVIFYGPDTDYFWEPQTTKLMQLLIKDSRTVIIAGSHIGYMVLMARRAMLNQNGVVHTFEPVPYLYDIAKENFRINKSLINIFLSKKALSNKDGNAKIKIDSLRSNVLGEDDLGDGEFIETITIDKYFEQKKINSESLDFVLLDVEGYEPQAIEGMEGVFSCGGPKDIIFEYQIKTGGDKLNAMLKDLAKKGYEIYYIKDKYGLENISKDLGEIKLEKFVLETTLPELSHRYANLLATKRKKDDLIILGVIVKK